jgi:hypothetical protein
MAYTAGAADNYEQDDYTAQTVREEARNDSALERQRKTEAEEAGVQDARHIGYAEVLNVYARRTDVEHLADRRARHLAANPADQAFTRQAGYDGAKQPQGTEEAQTTRTDDASPNADWTDDYTDGAAYVAPEE